MSHFLEIAQTIGSRVSYCLKQNLSVYGYRGIQSEDPQQSKSTHQVDKIAAEAIRKVVQNYPCRLFMESFAESYNHNPQFSIFIDPVDGSINWDRGIGDPAICLAISSKTNEVHFKDLSFVYIQGLRSGDIYCLDEGKAWYQNNLTGKTWFLKPTRPVNLHQAMGYLKTGYGGAQKQLEKTYSLFLKCKDVRAFDNSAMELAEMSRIAADFIVDTRDLSDSYNLLAYPLIKFVGGTITDLEGNDIGDYSLLPEQVINFIAAGTEDLHREIMVTMKQ